MKTNPAAFLGANRNGVRRRMIAAAVALSALLVWHVHSLLAQAAAQGPAPSYLSEMPSVDRVMKEMQASDPDETAAREMGAFTQLKTMIEEMAGPRYWKPGLTPEEAKLRQAYYTAYWQISQSKPQYKSFTAMRGYDVSPQFRADLIKRLFPPTFAAEYAKVMSQSKAQFQALHQQRLDAEKQEAQRQAQGAENSRQQYEAQQAQQAQQAKTSPEEREFNRCVESGRGEMQCMAEGLGKGINNIWGQVAPGTNIPTPPPGLRMSGAYTAANGSAVIFNSEMAGIACGEVTASREYRVEVKGNEIEVRTSDDSKTIVLNYRADGKLAGSGPITVTGAVPGGTTTSPKYGATTTTTTGQKQISQGEVGQYSPGEVHQNGQEYYVNETQTHTTYGQTGTTTQTQYVPKTKSCTLGLMTPGVSQQDVATQAMMHLLDSGTKQGPQPVGLRMNGTYTGQGGLEIEFQPDSAEVQCGQAVLAIPYLVERKEGQIAVAIKDPAGPFALTLAPGGKQLSGSGQIQVNGKSRSASCALGVLTASESGASGAAPAKASAATPSTTPAAAPVPAATMATPTAPTGNAVLTIVGTFAAPAGAPNPLFGHPLALLRVSYTDALTRGGFSVPAGMTPVKATALACNSRTPNCQLAINAVNAQTAAQTRADATGKATLPGVPPGNYYLVGNVRYNNQPLYFDLPVTLKPGANTLNLDQSSAKLADP
jgi:hypothetical protein